MTRTLTFEEGEEEESVWRARLRLMEREGSKPGAFIAVRWELNGAPPRPNQM